MIRCLISCRSKIITLSGGTTVSTTLMLYGNVTNVLVNGTLTVTNSAFGLMQRVVRAYGSPDAATNDIVYDGRGTIVQEIKYTGKSDPNIVLNDVYDNCNQLVQQTDAANRSKVFYHDPLNRPTGKESYDENANLVEWNYNYYNDNGDLVWNDGPRFNPEDDIWHDYDGAGRQIQESTGAAAPRPMAAGSRPKPATISTPPPSIFTTRLAT